MTTSGCTHCGEESPKYADFCVGCGKPLVAKSIAQPSQPRQFGSDAPSNLGRTEAEVTSIKRYRIIYGVIGVAIVAFAFFYFEPFIKDRGINDLEKIEKRFLDEVKVGESTSRIALSPHVSNLQSIKRDLGDLTLSRCLQEAKPYLDNYMHLKLIHSLIS